VHAGFTEDEAFDLVEMVMVTDASTPERRWCTQANSGTSVYVASRDDSWWDKLVDWIDETVNDAVGGGPSTTNPLSKSRQGSGQLEEALGETGTNVVNPGPGAVVWKAAV